MTAAHPTPGPQPTPLTPADMPSAGASGAEMSNAIYHCDHGALSVSGAKLLLPPSCPALFHHQRVNGRPPKRVYDIGHVAHKLVLDAGDEFEVIDATDYKTKAAQTQRDEARANGLIPILAHESLAAQEMAAAVKAHPIARALFSNGKPEMSFRWVDEESGVPLRMRLDWLPRPTSTRLLVPDLKTAASADPETFAKAAASYGYAQQAAWYMDGLRAVNYADDIAFLFVVVEKAAPFLVSVIELDAEAIRIGRGLNRRAIQIFKKCTETDTWPGYSSDVELVGLPVWWQRQHEEIS